MEAEEENRKYYGDCLDCGEREKYEDGLCEKCYNIVMESSSSEESDTESEESDTESETDEEEKDNVKTILFEDIDRFPERRVEGQQYYIQDDDDEDTCGGGNGGATIHTISKND